MMTKNRVCDLIGLSIMWAVLMVGSLLLCAFMFYAVDNFINIGVLRYVLAFAVEVIDVAVLYIGVAITQMFKRKGEKNGR